MTARPVAAGPAQGPSSFDALDVAYEAPGLPAWGLPRELAAAYGGDLGFEGPCLYANFVASLDGVVALGPEFRSSGSAISQREPTDRFMMALLRALADAVLIGAGTLRATPTHRWTPAHVWPERTAEFTELRRLLCRRDEPELIVVSARGEVPVDHPALQAGAVVATTTAGARRLGDALPDRCTVLALGDGPVLEMADVLQALSSRGHRYILTEGGPALLGQLVGERLLDELFLTVSPLLAGRAGTPRPGLVQGIELLPCCPDPAQLLSARRHGSYLFLRYRLHRSAG